MQFRSNFKEFKDASGNPFERPEGAPLSWRPSAYAAITSPDHPGCILMVDVSDTSFRWQLPGGGIEVEESMLTGLHREVLEETGYDCSFTAAEMISVGEKSFYWISRKSFHHTLTFIFSSELPTGTKPVQAINGDPLLPNEIKEARWIFLNDIDLEEVHPIHRDCVAKLKGGLKAG